MSTTTRPRTALLALLSASALILSGCGLAGGTPDDPPADAPQQDAPAAGDDDRDDRDDRESRSGAVDRDDDDDDDDFDDDNDD